MDTYDELRDVIHRAHKANELQGARWRFSPEGWDRVRAAHHDDQIVLDYPVGGGTISSVMGFPYVVTCDLPADAPFELSRP